MMAVPRPLDESKRLRALLDLHVLDTPKEENFEIFPALAATLFDAPISAVSLLDAERLWFKAIKGLDATEVPRDISFCAHTILQPEQVLLVPDATKDDRFSSNPLVTGGPGLRFYAGAPIKDPTTGMAVGALCVFDNVPRDISPAWLEQLKRLALGVGSTLHLHGTLYRLQQMALCDPLTGAANRVALETHLDRMLRTVGGDGPLMQSQPALLFLDLDRFKAINDLFGHAGGDAALVETVLRVRRVVRPTDVVARLGGDEFCVLLDASTLPENAEAVASRVHAALAETFAIDGKPVPLRTSIGIAFAPDDASDGAGLMARADEALYAAKHAGRGVTRRAGDLGRDAAPQPGVKIPGRRVIEQMLQEAFLPSAPKPFSLRYQPFFEGQRCKLAGFEALVRWPLGDGVEMQPGSFIPIAERTGMIVQVDQWVLRQACLEAASWSAPLTIATNLSAANFYASDIVEVVTAILAETGLPPERLKLEITENVLLRDAERVRHAIVELQHIGVRFALDDFGSGHASLAYLRDFPIDEVKIDRSFVASADQDDRTDTFFRAITDMCKAMKVDTLAEGVETERQLAMVRHLNVGAIQGFLLGRPVDRAQARLLIDQSANSAPCPGASALRAPVGADQ